MLRQGIFSMLLNANECHRPTGEGRSHNLGSSVGYDMAKTLCVCRILDSQGRHSKSRSQPGPMFFAFFVFCPWKPRAHQIFSYLTVELTRLHGSQLTSSIPCCLVSGQQNVARVSFHFVSFVSGAASGRGANISTFCFLLFIC